MDRVKKNIKETTVVIDITTDKEYEFKSRKEASEFTGIQRKHLSSYIQRGLIYNKRYKFLNKIDMDGKEGQDIMSDIKVEVLDDEIGIKMTHAPTGLVIITNEKNTQSENIQDALNTVNAILRRYITNPKDSVDRVINELVIAREIYGKSKLTITMDDREGKLNIYKDDMLGYEIII